jgi:ribosome-associated protein
MTEKVKKSRTQKKKEVQTLQKLGERLAELTPEQLRQIPMDEELLEALLLAQRIKKHEARRRQLQYIGSLMRQVDPDPIQMALSRVHQEHQTDIHVFRQTEKWRDQMLSGDTELIPTLKQQFNDLDDQKILTLIENSRSEKAVGRPPKASRALFRYLKPFAHRWVHEYSSGVLSKT